MIQLVVDAAVILVGLGLLAAIGAIVWRWGGQAEILTVIGEALLLGSRGGRSDRQQR